MLSSPGQASKPGESFATHVTRPFAAGTRTDVEFFKTPNAAQWNVAYQAYTKSPAKITALGVFETMGTSLRGILNSSSSYEQIVAAEADGIVNLVKGDLGFMNRNCTGQEEWMMARELLNLGRYLSGESLSQKISELEKSYRESTDERHKQHFQMSALFLLAGKGEFSRQAGWLSGLNQGVYEKASVYARDSRILPREVTAAADIDPKDIKVEKLPDGSFIYGHGIPASALHADAGFSVYPKIMALGTRKEPNIRQSDTFSIVVKIREGLSLVIMKPKSEKDNTLLPAYMMVEDAAVVAMQERSYENFGAAEEEISGSVNVDVQSSQGVSLKNRTINWSTKSSENNGILNYPVYREDRRNGTGGDATYSFLASAEAGPKFYYWCPTAEQMSKLKTFARITKPNGFSLHDLYVEISTESYGADSTVLQEIRDVITGRIPNFSH